MQETEAYGRGARGALLSGEVRFGYVSSEQITTGFEKGLMSGKLLAESINHEAAVPFFLGSSIIAPGS